MSFLSPERGPSLYSEAAARRRSYPAGEPLRYFDDAPRVLYDGPRYSYEDGVLRRQDGSQRLSRSPTSVDDMSESVSPVTTVAKPARYYVAGSDEEAVRLDAADGVIDGAHFGTPIYKSALSNPVATRYLSDPVLVGSPSLAGATGGPSLPTTRYVASDAGRPRGWTRRTGC
eukprot:TRINITY_DN7813_c0_g1_i1.p2 TRINITY_DN7813_c0_g1~~TRINITY_DN7813_c0_g1_i1.p2  ORF type:complete len:180 (+),score=38.03 TRINITY_DN7813_c0_g1_i1:26-541(+)